MSRFQPGSAARKLLKAEDAAHVSGDVGVMVLGVREDAAPALSDTDGDYTPLSMDSAGRIGIRSGAGDLGKAEDAAHVTADVGVMALGVRRDAAAASSGTDGDYEPFSLDNTGRLRIAAAPATGGVDIGDVDVLRVIPGPGAPPLG